ncbi:hypothetical protein [Caballeronia glebae]|uniref:hypothetical protein n=1 Tax=Caballeronia glebae TaxID=1777143 RepID=UPI000B35C14C|nr:hypothetical protein [Caballeronia glebae]
MSKVIPFKRLTVARSTRGDAEANCAHRNLRLAERNGIVTCADCLATTLDPLSALVMLSGQYSLAMSQIHRLTARIRLADAQILELSRELDAMSQGERPQNASPTHT